MRCGGDNETTNKVRNVRGVSCLLLTCRGLGTRRSVQIISIQVLF